MTARESARWHIMKSLLTVPFPERQLIDLTNFSGEPQSSKFSVWAGHAVLWQDGYYYKPNMMGIGALLIRKGISKVKKRSMPLIFAPDLLCR